MVLVQIRLSRPLYRHREVSTAAKLGAVLSVCSTASSSCRVESPLLSQLLAIVYLVCSFVLQATEPRFWRRNMTLPLCLLYWTCTERLPLSLEKMCATRQRQH